MSKDRSNPFEASDKAMAEAQEAVSALKQIAAESSATQRRLDQAERDVEIAERKAYAARTRYRRISMAFIIGLATKLYHRVKVNRDNAKKPRKKRGPTPQTALRLKGLKSVLREVPGTTAEQLFDRLEADSHLTFDDDDVELRIQENRIVVRDLNNGMTADIPIKSPRDPDRFNQLRTYLSEARKK